MSGCYNREVTGETTTYSAAIWAGLLVILGGLCAIPIGLVITARTWRGWLVVAVGPIISFTIGPSLLLDTVKVDANHFECRYGAWWSPSQFNIRFDELQSMQHIVEEKQGRRGKTYNHYLICNYKNGHSTKVSVGDLMKQALDDILNRARARNVPVLLPN
jgi:hypothetical protein